MVNDDELVTRSHALKYPVSRRQLERWRSDGVLPALTSRGRGRGLGQDRFYAIDPGEQLSDLVALRKGGISISECAIRLWLAGHPIDLIDVRRHFPRALKRMHAFRRHMQSPAFATRFAEYLQRTPLAREAWFGDRRWDRDRYDLIIQAMEVVVDDGEHSFAGREAFRSVAIHLTHLGEAERTLLVALGGDPDAMLDSIPTMFRRVFARLEAGTDEDFRAARIFQRSLLRLADVAASLVQLDPNTALSLIANAIARKDLETSYGVFLGFGILVLADGADVLSNIEQLVDQLTIVLRSVQSGNSISKG